MYEFVSVIVLGGGGVLVVVGVGWLAVNGGV